MTLPSGFAQPTDATHALPLHVIDKAGFDTWRDTQPAATQQWLAAHGFDASAGSTLAWSDGDGRLAGAVIGIGDAQDPFAYAHAPKALPAAWCGPAASRWHAANWTAASSWPPSAPPHRPAA